MKKLVDLNSWKRKEHFLLFKNFAEPFYGVCVEIDCTQAYRKAKELKTSFFLYYLHKSAVAANQTEAFRYRIVGDEVYVYDSIEPESTIDRNNGTFGFCHFKYNEDYKLFEKEASLDIEKIRNSTTLVLPKNTNAIHYSAVPWINFTSLSHARQFSTGDSCPKISFGKMTQKTDGRKVMPVSIHVHHALVDGAQIGEFIDIFQCLMNE